MPPTAMTMTRAAASLHLLRPAELFDGVETLAALVAEEFAAERDRLHTALYLADHLGSGSQS